MVVGESDGHGGVCNYQSTSRNGIKGWEGESHVNVKVHNDRLKRMKKVRRERGGKAHQKLKKRERRRNAKKLENA